MTGQRGVNRPRMKPPDRSRADGLIVRTHLLRILDEAMTKRVTVVSAPPGSGKTSLLQAWARRSSGSRRVALVTVNRDEHSEGQFWTDVRHAVQAQATPDVPGGGASMSRAADLEQVLAEVRSAMADPADPVILMIDDLHELKSPVALRQLERLLEELPDHVRVVLSSRRDPLIRLHQLRWDEGVAEIRADQLRFTELETRELVARSGVSLSSAGVAALHRRSEGWVAGLRLAIISLDGHAEPERFVAEFSGTHRAIGEYLMAEMLDHQPADVQRLLLRTSLVERTNGELGDILAERSGSDRVLLALEDANAFVRSVDAQRTWFRYHQLLADFLRLELRRTMADEIPELHRRAARWFADHGHVVEAVRHTVAAGQWPEAARLVADHSIRWVLDGEAATIRTVLEAFPPGASANHPDLALAHAAFELNRGRAQESAVHLAMAESHVQGAPPEQRDRLAVAVAALRLALARRSGQFSEVVEQVRLLQDSIGDARSQPVAVDSELRAVALLNLGIVETWTGRLSDAEHHLSQGAALAQQIGRPYLEVACRAHQGFPSATVSVTAARSRGLQAVALAEAYGLEGRPIIAPALGAVGGMAIWMGELAEGERWLRRAWEVGSAHVDPAVAVLLHLAAGMVHAGRRQLDAALGGFTAAAHAQSLLSGAHALAPRITGWLASTQARLGRLDDARETLSAFTPGPGRLGPIANARAVIHLTEDNPAAAVDELREIRDRRPPYEPFTLVETHLLAAAALLRLGDEQAAAAAVESALATAEPDRLMFPFAMADAGPLLEVLPHHRTAHGAFLRDVTDLLWDETSGGGQRESPRGGRLSPSELRVLGYLPSNLTRSEIANELVVSINTVNTHIRSLYAKLGARDRSAAVRRARQFRLLANGTGSTPQS